MRRSTGSRRAGPCLSTRRMRPRWRIPRRCWAASSRRTASRWRRGLGGGKRTGADLADRVSGGHRLGVDAQVEQREGRGLRGAAEGGGEVLGAQDHLAVAAVGARERGEVGVLEV